MYDPGAGDPTDNMNEGIVNSVETPPVRTSAADGNGEYDPADAGWNVV